MELTREVIKTALVALRGDRHKMKWQVEVGIPMGKCNPDIKETKERKLAEIEHAMSVFEHLLEKTEERN